MTEPNIDNLVKTVQELSREKSKLRDQLQTLRKNRNEREMEIERLNSRHSYLQGITAKMSHTCKVSEHKLDQMNKQFMATERQCLKKRENIDLLNKHLTGIKENNKLAQKKLEEKLDAIALEVKENYEFHRPNNLQMVIKETISEMRSTQSNITIQRAKLTALQKELEKEVKAEPEINFAEQKTVLNVLKEQKGNLRSNISDLKLSVAQLTGEYLHQHEELEQIFQQISVEQ